MSSMSLKGAVRGKKKRTTIPSPKDQCPKDLVNRKFTADRPNKLWVADFTYVSTWRGYAYAAFIIDVFSRMIVGWNVMASMTAQLTLNALTQALWARDVPPGLIHHSDKGSQYIAVRYTDKLHLSGIKASVGSVGDAYDNALAETTIGLYKTEKIKKEYPWKTIQEVEYATMEWVNWYNNKRLLESIGYIPPVEYERMYYSNQESTAMVAVLE